MDISAIWENYRLWTPSGLNCPNKGGSSRPYTGLELHTPKTLCAWYSYAKNDSQIQGMTGPVGNINLPPGYTRAHFPKFTFSVYAIEDTNNLSSNQLKYKMYYTPVVVHTFRLFTSRHDNVAPQKKFAHPFSITSMETVAYFRAIKRNHNKIYTSRCVARSWIIPCFECNLITNMKLFAFQVNYDPSTVEIVFLPH